MTTFGEKMTEVRGAEVVSGNWGRVLHCEKWERGRMEKEWEEEGKRSVLEVHPQNVRFQNVRFQNGRFQNVRFQNVWNVRFTKRQVYKMPGLQNVRSSKRPVAKKSIYIFCSCGWWKSAGSVAAMLAELCFILYFRGFFAIYHHNK